MYIILDHDNRTGSNNLIVFNTTDCEQPLKDAIELVTSYAWDTIGYELSEDGYESEDHEAIFNAISEDKYDNLYFNGYDLSRPTDENGIELDINYPIARYTVGEDKENSHTIEVIHIVTVLNYL